MPRTLLTVVLFACLALGVALAADRLMPAPPAATGTDAVLDTREAPAEPVGRAGVVVAHASQLGGDR